MKDMSTRIRELRKDGQTMKEISNTLNKEGYKTTKNKAISPSIVNYLLNSKKTKDRVTGNTSKLSKKDFVDIVFEEKSISDAQKLAIIKILLK